MLQIKPTQHIPTRYSMKMISFERKDTASGGSNSSHRQTDNSTHQDNAPEQDIELFNTQLGSHIINEGMHLAKSKNSQGLQKQNSNLP